jgi:aryl-alcohol dehydrogenase-like predicted oxidoreductase
MKMQYRRLGGSGIRVSVLSLGSWVTFGNQVDLDASLELLDAARQAGVNFFDNAEAYAGGESEAIMGRASSPTSAGNATPTSSAPRCTGASTVAPTCATR